MEENAIECSVDCHSMNQKVHTLQNGGYLPVSGGQLALVMATMNQLWTEHSPSSPPLSYIGWLLLNCSPLPCLYKVYSLVGVYT